MYRLRLRHERDRNHKEVLGRSGSSEWGCFTIRGMGLQIFMKVSINGGDPKSSISIVLFIINHPFWGMPMYGTPHIWMHTCKCVIMVNQSWFISRLANGLCPIASSHHGVYLSTYPSMHPCELSVPVNEIYHDISYILCWVILVKKLRKLCVHHLKHVDMFFNRTKRVLACSSPVLFGLNSANVFVDPGSCHLRETVSFPGSSWLMDGRTWRKRGRSIPFGICRVAHFQRTQLYPLALKVEENGCNFCWLYMAIQAIQAIYPKSSWKPGRFQIPSENGPGNWEMIDLLMKFGANPRQQLGNRVSVFF